MKSAAKSTKRVGGMCVVWVRVCGRWEEKGDHRKNNILEADLTEASLSSWVAKGKEKGQRVVGTRDDEKSMYSLETWPFHCIGSFFLRFCFRKKNSMTMTL